MAAYRQQLSSLQGDRSFCRRAVTLRVAVLLHFNQISSNKFFRFCSIFN